jgi:signal transduction histidine kinase
VTHLPWLSPGAASLVALARLPFALSWQQIRLDPGGVLLLVGQASAGETLSAAYSFPCSVNESAILEEAVRRLDHAGVGFVDWNQPQTARIYKACLDYARLSWELARRSGRGDPEAAWAAGMLAPLGWLAVCAVGSGKAPVGPGLAAACWHDPDWPRDAESIQRRLWGLDQGSIARRLSRRWQLPRWMTAVTGHLNLPVGYAQLLGADPDLFLIVQLAVGLVQRHGQGLDLAVATGPEQCAEMLKVIPSELLEIERGMSVFLDPEPVAMTWQAPADQPLLRDLLLLAAENRRLRQAPGLASVEDDLDHLHRALHEQLAGERKRLEALKLSGLAEFAAGAGHEINNPLAVISGQAQYLLSHESDPARQRSLQAVISQTQRIHQILNELMVFARPPRPQKQMIDMQILMREVTAALTDLAVQRRVRLRCSHPDQPVIIYGDPGQVYAALSCLLRNAIEAAPADTGCAEVRLETPAPDRLELVVEDNGNGLTQKQREHMFDPFYSGRQAGRGRGLGLSTAWRLTREHGGELRLEDLPRGPTRFVLSLPVEINGLHQPNGHVSAAANGHHPTPS